MAEFNFTRQQEEFIRASEQIVIGSGSVGAGKSYVIGTDAYATAIQYPNSRILITRDNFTDLRKSTIQTLLSKVIPKENVIEHNKSEHRIVVKADGGKTSEIWYEGLDKGAGDDYPTKIGSTEFNRIYVDEGFELDKGDFQFLLTRLRHEAFNRSNERCSWQIKTATNPGGPTHWMKTDYIDREEERDDIKVVRFLTEDNEFIDEKYLENLKQQYPDGSMMRDRLLKGKWVASEGLVYPNFDMNDHVVNSDEFLDDYSDYKRIVVGADSGWKNPRALVVIGVTGSGTLHVLDEFYRSKTSVQDAVDWLDSKDYNVETIYHDPSEPEEIQEFKQSGYRCEKGVNDIIPGITQVSKYFAGTDNKEIVVNKECTNFVNELLSYRYPEGKSSRGKNRNEDETPIKENDHLCLIPETEILTKSGIRKLENVQVGDKVLTRKGWKAVEGKIKRPAEVLTVKFSNGKKLTGTSDHPVMTEEGWSRLDSLCKGTKVCIVNNQIWNKYRKMSSSIKEKNTKKEKMAISESSGKKATPLTCIEKFGENITEKSQTANTSITKTATNQTMTFQILRQLLQKNTQKNMMNGVWESLAKKQEKKLRSGINQSKVNNGIQNTVSKFGKIKSQRQKIVNNVDKSLSTIQMPGFVPTNASQNGGESLALMTNSENVFSAESSLQPINTEVLNIVQVSALEKHHTKKDVVNLKIEDQHEYFANQVLTHNCDGFRYAIMGLKKTPDSNVSVGSVSAI